ncbi:MAG: peroxidase family protein [Phycisphaerales bacterium]
MFNPRLSGVRAAACVGAIMIASGGVRADGDSRAYDGWGNNVAHPEWGSALSNLMRMMNADYADGVSDMGGAGRPSPRVISDAFHQGRTPRWSQRVLTSMVFHWGQFIDHDIDLTTDTSGESAPISIPGDDAWMTPGGTIPFIRSIYDPTTGLGPGDPREQVNMITSYIDGSNVYGSSEARALALREFVNGRLLEGPNGLLPWNTLGVSMADPFGRPPEQLFAAGDVRANEQPGLTALHTLFVREHNRLAARYKQVHPNWNDEQLYQRAREYNWALIQAITYNEFLPALLGEGAMPPYTGYKTGVNASIASEFSAGSYRFGHSMVNPTLPRYLEGGVPHPSGPLDLFSSFFNPDAIISSGGIEPILRGEFGELAQEIDPFVVDDLRNLLFGGGGIGLDLASINIQRGRDHGLRSYNDVREAMGLGRAQTWSDISSVPDVQQRLASVYATPDDVDLWIGGLCEDHLPGSSLGPTHQAVIVDQFKRLRDGDRYFYASHLSANDVFNINQTTLADVIRRNTNIHFVQDNVFFVSADLNRDADVNYLDVIDFLVAFSAGDDSANFVPDLVLDFNDVLAFLTAFNRYF